MRQGPAPGQLVGGVSLLQPTDFFLPILYRGQIYAWRFLASSESRFIRVSVFGVHALRPAVCPTLSESFINLHGVKPQRMWEQVLAKVFSLMVNREKVEDGGVPSFPGPQGF